MQVSILELGDKASVRSLQSFTICEGRVLSFRNLIVWLIFISQSSWNLNKVSVGVLATLLGNGEVNFVKLGVEVSETLRMFLCVLDGWLLFLLWVLRALARLTHSALRSTSSALWPTSSGRWSACFALWSTPLRFLSSWGVLVPLRCSTFRLLRLFHFKIKNSQFPL